MGRGGINGRVCKDKLKTYCPFCGNSSLKRVQATITSKGIVGIGDFLPPGVVKHKGQQRKAKSKRKHKKEWTSYLLDGKNRFIWKTNSIHRIPLHVLFYNYFWFVCSDGFVSSSDEFNSFAITLNNPRRFCWTVRGSWVTTSTNLLFIFERTYLLGRYKLRWWPFLSFFYTLLHIYYRLRKPGFP